MATMYNYMLKSVITTTYSQQLEHLMLILCANVAFGYIDADIADSFLIVRRHYIPRLTCASRCGGWMWQLGT